MALKAFLIAMAIVAAVVAPAMAIEIVVGDENGWRLNFDYQAWAAGKKFYVGDKLVFKYYEGAHNVIRANQTEFQLCSPALDAAPLITGNDVITLATPGKKWYFCSVGKHCQSGMKLAINVLPGVGAPAMPKEIVVGDESGWRLKFDYQAWAAGKNFYVGDKLVFKYSYGAHNVIRANQTEFQLCAKALNAAPLTTGNDVITLATPGRKWYFCGVGLHCQNGMKLAINVLPRDGAPAWTPAPAPAPSKYWRPRFF